MKYLHLIVVSGIVFVSLLSVQLYTTNPLTSAQVHHLDDTKSSPHSPIVAQAGQVSTFIWPISGQGEVPGPEDLPISSTYGPRIRSGSGLFDFHHGLDLKTPYGTPMLSIADGVIDTVEYKGGDEWSVTIAHPYSDTTLYSDYNHLSVVPTTITAGVVVTQGQVIAFSGRSESGFDHLHFETRLDCDNRRCALNPLTYLPYHDTVSQTVIISQVTASQVLVVVKTDPTDDDPDENYFNEVDLNRFTLTVTETVTGTVVLTRVYDMHEINVFYDGEIEFLDDDALIAEDFQVDLQPHIYRSASNVYGVDVTFLNLGLDQFEAITLQACAIDVHGGQVCATHTPEGSLNPGGSTVFDFYLYLPLLKR